MRLWNKKVKELTRRVKGVNGCRYIDVDGIRYAVGIGYIMRLAREYNVAYGVEAGIDDVLKDCYGNSVVTDRALERIILALRVSISHYNESVGGEAVTDDYVVNLIDTKGFGYIGNVLIAVSTTLTAMMVAGSESNDEQSQQEKAGVEKKS